MADDDYLDAVDYTRDDLDIDDLEEVKHAVRLQDVHRMYNLDKNEIGAVIGVCCHLRQIRLWKNNTPEYNRSN